MNKQEIIKEIKANREFSFEFMSDEIKGDKEIILLGIKHMQYSGAIMYASEELRNDKELVLAAVKKYGNSLEYASEKLRNDKELVLAAVKETGFALKFASKELCNDKEVVTVALNSIGDVLEYASEELRNTKEIVLLAIQNSKFSDPTMYASEEIRNDKDFMLLVLKHGISLKNASERLRDDKDVVMVAVGKYGFELEYASERLRKDKEVIQCALDSNKDAIEYALIDSLEEISGIENFPADIGIIIQELKLNNSPILYCWFEPDILHTDIERFHFTYDFSKGLLIDADDLSRNKLRSIKVPHPELNHIASIWGVSDIEGLKHLKMHGASIDSIYGEVSNEEVDIIESYLNSVIFRKICEAVLYALT